MPIRRSPNGAHHTPPQPGRDRPEQVVAINRNAWSQSIGISGRNHPVRAAYKIGAGECLADSRVLLADSFSDRTGHFIITLHAIELALKAFLIARGYTETDLKGRSFGHDLEKLYAAAKAS